MWEHHAKRFWSKVKFDDGCWLWQASPNGRGYGQFAIGSHPYKAHRIAYILTNGKLPPDKPYVLHTCDTPLCVRPDHLYAGTALDNAADMKARGRRRYKGGFSKLRVSNVHPEDAKAMHYLYTHFKISFRNLCRLFLVSETTARRIVTNAIQANAI